MDTAVDRLEALERKVEDLSNRSDALASLAFDMLGMLRDLAPLDAAARLADALAEVEDVRREGDPSRLKAAVIRASWFQNGAFPADDTPPDDIDPAELN